MRDDETCAVGHQAVERLLDEPFCSHIHAGRCFVEHEDWRIFQESARYREALLLSDAKPYSALSELAVKTVREALNELRGVRCFKCRPKFIFGGCGITHAKVFCRRTVEEKTLLGDHCDVLAEETAGQSADLPAVHKDLSGVVFVKAHKKVDHRRFACARRADKGNHLAGTRMQADVSQYRQCGCVSKVNVPELDFAAQRNGRGALVGFRCVVEDFENAFPCRASRLKELIKLVQAPDRFVKEAGEHEECHQTPISIC